MHFGSEIHQLFFPFGLVLHKTLSSDSGLAALSWTLWAFHGISWKYLTLFRWFYANYVYGFDLSTMLLSLLVVAFDSCSVLWHFSYKLIWSCLEEIQRAREKGPPWLLATSKDPSHPIECLMQFLETNPRDSPGRLGSVWCTLRFILLICAGWKIC